MTTAILMTAAEVSATTCYCVYSAAEAAAKLGVSERSVRRAARDLGVRKITGGVAGFVAWPHAHGQYPVVMSYAA